MNRKPGKVNKILIGLLVMAACLLFSGCRWLEKPGYEPDAISNVEEKGSGSVPGEMSGSTTVSSAGHTGDGSASSASNPADSSDTSDAFVFPAYTYPGTDALYRAICEYIVSNFASESEASESEASESEASESEASVSEVSGSKSPDSDQGNPYVCIPCPLIVDIDESNPEDVRISGEFWCHKYTIKGDVLQTISSENIPGMLHLRKKAAEDNAESTAEYEVTGIDIAVDGTGGTMNHSNAVALNSAGGGKSIWPELSVPVETASAEEIFGENYQAYVALGSFISIREIFRTQMLEDYLFLNQIPAVRYQDSEYKTVDLVPKTASLMSADQLAMHDTDGSGQAYSFSYDSQTFTAQYRDDNWKIIDSWKIRNAADMELICGALLDIHSIDSRDGNGIRTAEDMAFEWMQHNFAYEHLPEDHPWRENAKDVDLNPADQGKTFFEIYEDRAQDRFRIGGFLGDMTMYLQMLQEMDPEKLEVDPY